MRSTLLMKFKSNRGTDTRFKSKTAYGRRINRQHIVTLLAAVGLGLTPVLTANAAVPKQYEDSCGACHATGALHAPKTGDAATWTKLIAQKGMPALVASVKNGGSQMPAGGLCSDCNDTDYQALIEYMAK